MKHTFVLLIAILSAIVFLGSCSDNPVAPQVKDRSLTFVVSEVLCPYSFNSWETREFVRADLWFESLEDGTLLEAKFESPGYATIDLPFGDYLVTLKTGRGHNVSTLPQILTHSDTGFFVTRPDTLSPYYWLGLSKVEDTLLIRNFGIFTLPDTALFQFYYHSPHDSLGMVAELSYLHKINERLGGQLAIDTTMREIYSPDWTSSVAVSYTVAVKRPMYLFEALNACQAIIHMPHLNFPDVLHVYEKYSTICTG